MSATNTKVQAQSNVLWEVSFVDAYNDQFGLFILANTSLQATKKAQKYYAKLGKRGRLDKIEYLGTIDVF